MARRAFPLTIAFPLYDPAYSRPTPLSGLGLSAGQSQISQDGGAFANTTNLPVEIGFGIYSLALTAAERSADFIVLLIAPIGADQFIEQIQTNQTPSGTAVTGTLTATSFSTTRTESTADYWKDALLVFTTGALAGQIKKVSAYTVSGGVLTVSSAFTGAPSNGDRFVLLNE